MGSKWPEFRLDEITTLIIDCPHSTPEWTDSGVIVLRSNNIRNGALDLANPSFTTEEGYLDRIKRAIPAEDDIVLTREAPMGEVCIIPKGLKCCLGQRMVLIRADKTQVIPEYLLYAIQSSYIQNQISWNEGTGTTVSNIRIPNIKALKIPLPSLNIQRGIVSNLLSIDKKISLNIATNQTLEQMSQTLFKSWFVDFDPVIDNALEAGNPIPETLKSRAELRQKVRNSADFKPLPADIRALFPAEFEETELGWVPKGWLVTELGELVTVKRGGSPRPIHDFLRAEGFPWVKISDATASSTRFLMSTKEFIKREGLNKTVLLKKGSLILSNSATPGLPKFLDIEACIHDGWLYFPEKEKLTDIYLYNLFLEIKEQLISQGNGSVFTNLKTDILKQFKITVPSEGIISYFDKLGTELHKKILDVTTNTENLTNLRDTLLPKLISGELSLEDLPNLVAQTEPA